MRRLVTLLLLAAGAARAAGVDPPYSLVRWDEGMARYAEAAASAPASERQALWQRHVIDPYWAACAEGTQYLDLAPSMREPFGDLQALQRTTAAVREARIAERVHAALTRAATLLPAPTPTVCIIAADSTWTHLPDMGGVGGFTPGAGRIWLTILPTSGWEGRVGYAVAHEYHHGAWLALHGERDPITDLADYLVFEGRADSFAQQVEATEDVPWIHALTPAQERSTWRVMQRHLDAEDAGLLLGLMFGGAEGVPRWSGYTIGFHIVQAFLRTHAQVGIAEWTAMEARALLRDSGYDGPP